MLLNAAKCQGYSFYGFWVIQRQRATFDKELHLRKRYIWRFLERPVTYSTVNFALNGN